MVIEPNENVKRPSTSGALSLKDTHLTDSNGNSVQLRGVSTHGPAWYPEYVNQDCFNELAGWGANVIRLAMYTSDYNGYCTGGDQAWLKNMIRHGVQYATNADMYVIIDNTGSTGSTSGTETRLPQTGQLNWSIWVFGGLGVIAPGVGIWLGLNDRRNRKKFNRIEQHFFCQGRFRESAGPPLVYKEPAEILKIFSGKRLTDARMKIIMEELPGLFNEQRCAGLLFPETF